MTITHPELPADERPDDELVTEILARRRRRTPLLTLALVVLLAAGAAFVGGIEAQKHFGHTTTAATGGARGAGGFSALAARFATRSGGGFPSFGGRPAGGSITRGTVTLIKGSTLYVTDATGNTVLVRTSPASAVTKTVSGTVKTVLPGDTVTVTGTEAKNGSITASAIAIGGGSSE